MAEAGRPTDLTPELIKEIRRCILNGKNLKDTATEIYNNYAELRKEEKENGLDNYIQKIYNWHYDNYLKIADKVDGWKRDRKILLATNNLEEFLVMDTKNMAMSKGGTPFMQEDTGLVRVKADMTKFTLETLDKGNHSKRIEQTGAGGKDLIPTQDVRQHLDNIKGKQDVRATE